MGKALCLHVRCRAINESTMNSARGATASAIIQPSSCSSMPHSKLEANFAQTPSPPSSRRRTASLQAANKLDWSARETPSGHTCRRRDQAEVKVAPPKWPKVAFLLEHAGVTCMTPCRKEMRGLAQDTERLAWVALRELQHDLPLCSLDAKNYHGPCSGPLTWLDRASKWPLATR